MEENLISDHNPDVARSRASHRSCTELLQLDLLSAAAASAADQKRLRVITDQLGGSNPKPRQYSTFSGDQLECGSTTGLNGLTEKDSKPNAMTIRPYCRPTMSHGEISLKGFRRDMEDTVATIPGFYPGHDFFGVYDGHGGAEVAEVCRERMHALLAGEMRKNRSSGGGVGAEDKFGGGLLRRWWTEIMEASFKAVDAEVSRPKSGGKPPSGKTTGSTAVVAAVGSRDIVIANCGDCRAVLCRGGEAVPLSCDHKPNRPDELARIEAAGGRVIDWGGHRVLGVLATSRSIGDQFLKPYVTSEPEVTVTPRNDSDEFLILASDGLWDTVSNEAACAVARRCLAGLLLPKWTAADGAGGGGNAAEVAAAVLAQLAMSRGSRDNVSVVVVELKKLTGIGRRRRKGQALKRRNGESTCGIDS